MTPTSAVVERMRSFRLTGRSSTGRAWGRRYGSSRVRGLRATALGQSGYRWGKSVLRYAACTTLRSSVIVGLLCPGVREPRSRPEPGPVWLRPRGRLAHFCRERSSPSQDSCPILHVKWLHPLRRMADSRRPATSPPRGPAPAVRRRGGERGTGPLGGRGAQSGRNDGSRSCPSCWSASWRRRGGPGPAARFVLPGLIYMARWRGWGWPASRTGRRARNGSGEPRWPSRSPCQYSRRPARMPPCCSTRDTRPSPICGATCRRMRSSRPTRRRPICPASARWGSRSG